MKRHLSRGVDSDAFPQRSALIAKAVGGDANGQSRMGDICRTGDRLTEQDYAGAPRWYRLAAEQGDSNAQNNIGAMYEHGMGVPADMAEAAQWYRVSAIQGLAIAQYNLGEFYLYGTGVAVDAVEAAAWLHKAVALGDIKAISKLGTMYLFGRGVQRRIVTAAEMLTVAALDGDMNALGTLADYHDQIEADATHGSVLSGLCLAKMFDRGLGVEQNKAKMFAWLLWGEERGTHDDDADVREEHESMRGFYGMVLSDDIKDGAWAIFNQMRAEIPGFSAASPRRAKASPHQ